MEKVSIDSLRDSLAHYIKVASAGQTVLVTDQNRVVAELRMPPSDPVEEWNIKRSAAGQPCLTPFEERSVREGWLRPAKAFGPPPSIERPADEPEITFEQLMEDLARDREDR